MRITFIIESNYNSGGMERMLSVIANDMSKYFSVSVLTAYNKGRKDFFSFDKNVKRIDLGLDNRDRGRFMRSYCQGVAHYLKDIAPQDVCVSLGSSEFTFLPKLKDGSKKVLWYHFALNHDMMTSHVSRYGVVNWSLGMLRTARRLYVARKYDHVVVLSKEDEKAWRHYVKNVSYIYNPVAIEPTGDNDYASKRAIAVGRLDRQKGYDFLFNAWSIVHQRHPEWQLDVFGSGRKEDYQPMINTLGLQDVVHLQGTTSNIAKEYACHSFLVLSSRFEGFGLVLVEAGAAGLPLVSYNCKSGPSEIIRDGYDGYLVDKVGDIHSLADAICKMIESEADRRLMGERARKDMTRFSMQNISKRWKNLFQTL